MVYGRRRVGKTELLRAFCQSKRHIFFVADLGTESSVLGELTRRISEFAYGNPEAIGPFPSWDTAFEFVIRLATDERLVLVLDEFTYLIGANAAIPSILQRLWDTRLKESQLMLVLCGSYVGMMEQHVLAYRAPLYGRRTGQWRLNPLVFEHAALFFPRFRPVDLVRAYATLGGVPAYLLQFDDHLSVLENIERRILTAGSYLYEEPRFLLIQELGDAARYFSVLEAIAAGRTRQNEIAQAAGIASPSLPFYLGTLRELGLVERAVPATESHPEKSKRGIYRLLDHYFRFWFRFVYPNRSLLERGDVAQVRSQVAEQQDQFIGPAFELICREHIGRLQQSGELPFTPRAVGGWWGNGEEIDILALGDNDTLVGECKWSTHPVGTNVLDDLKRKAALVGRREHWPNVRYALFSRAGFTPGLQAVAAAEGVRLVDVDGLCR